MARNQVTGKGSYNVICDECGFKYKAHELRRRWDGAMVCKWDWEPRHPQEFIRAKRDNVVLPYVRTEPEGTDVGPTLNCDSLTYQDISARDLNALLADDVTAYKMRVVGGGTIIVSTGATLTIKCELVI